MTLNALIGNTNKCDVQVIETENRNSEQEQPTELKTENGKLETENCDILVGVPDYPVSLTSVFKEHQQV